MRAYFNAIKWETILGLKEYSRYRIGLLMDFILFTGTFIAIYYFGISSGFSSFYDTSEATGSVLLLIGYIFWQNSSAALGYCTGTISNETSQGIFEVRLQSKYPLEGILFCRLMVSCLLHVITYIGIIAFCGIAVGFNVRDVLVILLSILVSFPALIGMYGIGLIFGSVCICEKNVGSLILIVQTLLLFVSNTLSPSRSQLVNLIPFSCGIDIMRNVYMKLSVSGTSVLSYLFINIIWLVIGCICFRKALKHERTYGSFDNY